MATVQEATGRAGGTSPAQNTHAPALPTQDYAAGYTDADRASGRRSFLVALILIGVMVATFSMVAFIWYRWHGVQEPTSAIIIDGDPNLDGIIVAVRGGPKPISTKLHKGNSFTAAILVDPGRYWVSATRGEEQLFNREVEVKRFLGVRFNLTNYLADVKAAREKAAAQAAGSTP
jgi:hypothetical protein